MSLADLGFTDAEINAPSPVAENKKDDYLSSVISDKPVDNVLLGVPGRKNWANAFTEIAENPASFAPYLNSKDIFDSGKVYVASRAVQNGTATPEQNEYLNNFLAQRQREATFGYKAWSQALRMPAYAIEYLTGGGFIKGGAKAVLAKATGEGTEAALKKMAGRGLVGVAERAGARTAIKLTGEVSKDSAGYKIAKFLGEDVSEKLALSGKGWLSAQKAAASAKGFSGGTAGIEALKQQTIKLAGSQLKQAAGEAIPRTLLQPHRVANGLVQNMTPMYGLSEDEQGTLHRVLVDEGDSFLPAFAKAFGDIAIENFSESTSESFILLRGLYGAKAKSYLAGGFLEAAATKIAKKTGTGKAATVKRLLSDYFLGKPGDVGFAQKMGWNGVIGEMGEEAIGGAMRQATGISPVGLPNVEDVAAMAVGFAINPLAIGNMAYDSTTDILAKKIANVEQVVKDLEDGGVDVMKDPEKAKGIINVVRDSVEYIRAANAKEDKDKLGLMDRFMRKIIWNNVEAKVRGKLMTEVGKGIRVDESDDTDFLRLGHNQFVLEGLADSNAELSDEMIVKSIEAMTGYLIVDPATAEKIRTGAVKETKYSGQYKDGKLTGIIDYTRGFAPTIAIEQGSLTNKEFENIVKKAPHVALVTGYDNLNPIIHKVLDNKTFIPDAEAPGKQGQKYAMSDKEVYEWGNKLGLYSAGVDVNSPKGSLAFQIKDISSLRSKVKTRADKLNKLAKQLPQGRRIAIAPALLILDSKTKFKGEPMAQDADAFDNTGNLLMSIGSAYNKKTDTIFITPTTMDTDLTEDTIESIINPPDQGNNEDGSPILDDFVMNLVNAVKTHSADAAEALSDAKPIEIFSKTVKTLVFGYTPRSEQDLAYFVTKFDMKIDDLVEGGAAAVSGYLEWKARQQGANVDLFKTIENQFKSNFETGQKYEHEGFTPKYSLTDLKKFADNEKKTSKEKVDTSFSLTLDYTPEKHAERYLGRTRTYLTNEYQNNRGKLDDKEFISAMINKHGRAIVPYIKQFFTELYSGEIKITQAERRKKREAKAEPQKKIPDDTPAQEVPPVGEAVPKAPVQKPAQGDQAVPPVGGVDEAATPDEEAEEEAPDEEVPDVGVVEEDEEAEEGEQIPPPVQSITPKPGSPEAEGIEVLSAEARSEMSPKAQAKYDLFKERLGKDPLQAVNDAIGNSYSLIPVDATGKPILGSVGLQTSALDGVETPEEVTSSDQQVLQAVMGEDNFMTYFNKVNKVVGLVDFVSEEGDNSGAEVFYKESRILAGDTKVKLTEDDLASIEWLETLMNKSSSIGKDYVKSVRKFFASSEKVYYQHAVIGKDGEIIRMESSYGTEGKGRGRKKKNITEAWLFHNVEGKNTAGLLMHSMGLRYLKESGRNYSFLDGARIDGASRDEARSASHMSADDRRKVQKSLWKQSTKSSFDLIISRFGEKGITPIMTMPKYSGEELEKQKEAFAKRWKALPKHLQTIVSNPEDIEGDMNWNIEIARDQVYREMFGTYGVFNDQKVPVEFDMMKRTHQVFTPGFNSSAPFKYVLFEDNDLFDGSAFYNQRFAEEHYDDMGRLFINPEENNFIKGFMTYKTQNGNFVNNKPLLKNIDVLQGKPYYDSLKNYLDQLNEESNIPVILVPTSSAKVRGERKGKSTEVEIAGYFEDGTLNLDEDYQSKMQLVDAGDMIVTAWMNFTSEPQAKTLLKQIESIKLLYKNDDMLASTRLYNRVFDEITKSVAEGLEFKDIMPELLEDASKDDINKFSEIGRLMRAGFTTEEILQSVDSIPAISIFASAMAGIMASKANRTLKVAVAEGQDHDTSRALQPDPNGGMKPATGDNGRMNKKATETEDGDYAVWDNEQDMWHDRYWYPFVYVMDGNGEITNEVNEKWITRENGKIYAFKDAVIASRTPASSPAFGTPTGTANWSSDSIASFFLGDAMTSKYKGEDNDGDFVYVDGLFRFKDSGKVILDTDSEHNKLMALSNRAFLLSLQGMLSASADMLESHRKAPTMTMFQSVIDKEKARLEKAGIKTPSLTSEKGQTYWDNVVSEGKKSLGIAASQSLVNRYMDYLGIYSDNSFIIDKEIGLEWERPKTVVDNLTQKELLDRDFYFHNILVNMYVDDAKEPRVFMLHHDRYTVPLLYGIIMGNPTVSSEADAIDLIDKSSQYFAKPIIKEYRRVMRAIANSTNPAFDRYYKPIDHLAKMVKDGTAEFTQEDVDNLEKLLIMNQDTMKFKSYIDLLSGSSIGSVSDFDRMTKANDMFEAGESEFFTIGELDDESVGAVVRKSSDIVGVLSRKIFNKDIAYSELGLLVKEGLKGKNVMKWNNAQKRKNIFSLIAAIDSVDKGDGLSRIDLSYRLDDHKKKYKGNMFVDRVESYSVKVSGRRKVLWRLTDKYRKKAQVSKLDLQEVRDAFEELPEDVKRDYLLAQLHHFGLTSSHMGGGWMRYIGDDTYIQFNRDFIAEVNKWSEADKDDKQIEHITKWVGIKLSRPRIEYSPMGPGDAKRTTSRKKKKVQKQVGVDPAVFTGETPEGVPPVGIADQYEELEIDNSESPEAVNAEVPVVGQVDISDALPEHDEVDPNVVPPVGNVQGQFSFSLANPVVNTAFKATTNVMGNKKILNAYKSGKPIKKALQDAQVPKDQIDALLYYANETHWDGEDLEQLVENFSADHNFEIKVDTSGFLLLEADVRETLRQGVGWTIFPDDSDLSSMDQMPDQSAVYEPVIGEDSVRVLDGRSDKERILSMEDAIAEIVGIEKMSTDRVTHYASLSVNRGNGDYQEHMITLPFKVPGAHGSFTNPNLAGWFRGRAYDDEKTFEVQEFQSHLFQKNKEFKAERKLNVLEDESQGQSTVRRSTDEEIEAALDGLVGGRRMQFFDGASLYWRDGDWYIEDPFLDGPPSKVTRRQALVALRSEMEFQENELSRVRTDAPQEIEDLWDEQRAERNNEFMPDEPDMDYWENTEPGAGYKYSVAESTFLRLLGKDQRWVSVFQKAIIQWAARNGYEKVRFPAGETAAKVEGLTSVRSMITSTENRLQKDAAIVEELEGVLKSPNLEQTLIDRMVSIEEEMDKLLSLVKNEMSDIDSREPVLQKGTIPRVDPLVEGYQHKRVQNTRSMNRRPSESRNILPDGYEGFYIFAYSPVTPVNEGLNASSIAVPISKDEANAVLRSSTFSDATIAGALEWKERERYFELAGKLKELTIGGIQNKLQYARDRVQEAENYLKRLNTEGLEKLAPIENFYENRVRRLLEKDRQDLERVTDFNGNEWFETSITPDDANSQVSFSLTWANAVSTEAMSQAQRRYDNPVEQRVFAKRYNDKWRNVVSLIERDQEHANELADRYNLPDRLRSKINTLLRLDRDGERVLIAQERQPEQQSFNFSLQPFKKMKAIEYNQLGSGQHLLHSEYVRVRNKAEREIITGRLYVDRMQRIAGGLKGIGYWYEENPDGTFSLYDMDDEVVENEFRPVKNGQKLTRKEAVAIQKKRDKELTIKFKGDKKLSKSDIAKVMSAVTARREDINAKTYMHVTSTGEYKEDATVEELSIQDAINLVGDIRFQQILSVADAAMRHREVVAEEMEALAGQDWINEWAKTDKSGALVSRYLPHFYRREKEAGGNVMPNKSQEDSKRSRAREFDTYQKAYKSSKVHIPVTTDASELVGLWFEDVWGAAVNRTMITLGANMRDVDAAPLWIPKYKLENIEDPDAYKTSMKDEQIQTVYTNLLDHLKTLALRHNRKVIEPEFNKKTQIMVNNLVSSNLTLLRLDGYEMLQQSSKFASIENWYVKKGQPADNLLKMLEQRPLEWRFFGGRNWANGINRFNNWSKNATLSFSLFHPVSLVESLIAIGGLTVKNYKSILQLNKTARDIMNMRKRVLADKELVQKWVGHGARLNPTNPNYDNNQLYKDMKFLDGEFDKMNLGYLKKATSFWRGYNDKINRYLWSSFFPAIKLWAAESVYTELVQDFKERGVAYDNDKVLDDISKLVNDAFGGQNWDQYLWATPQRMQMLHMMMFAPDWTLSAFNVSGAGNLPVLRDFIPQTEIQKEWQMSRYWPGMVVLVMAAIPQAVQLALFAAAKALPGPDDEDARPFLFQNEPGMNGIGGVGGHIDVTPVLRKLGYRGDPTGKRRIYIRWAKQANEVFEGWATKPIHTLMNKTSPSVKTAIEQMIGNNTAGWELGFKDKNLVTGLFRGEKGFTDSRTSYIGQKFIPMSVLSLLQGRPSSIIAPMKKGMSNFQAQKTMATILTAYADDDVWNRVKKNKQYKDNLSVLGVGVLEAASRNGLDPEAVLAAAKRQTLATLYNRFFQELNRGKYSKLEKTANSVLRVNGTIEGIERSMKIRSKNIGRTYTAADQEAIRKAFE